MASATAFNPEVQQVDVYLELVEILFKANKDVVKVLVFWRSSEQATSCCCGTCWHQRKWKWTCSHITRESLRAKEVTHHGEDPDPLTTADAMESVTEYFIGQLRTVSSESTCRKCWETDWSTASGGRPFVDSSNSVQSHTGQGSQASSELGYARREHQGFAR